MAVHITIYPEEPVADELRRFMAAHACSATEAVGLLLAHLATTTARRIRQPVAGEPNHGAVA